MIHLAAVVALLSPTPTWTLGERLEVIHEIETTVSMTGGDAPIEVYRQETRRTTEQAMERTPEGTWVRITLSGIKGERRVPDGPQRLDVTTKTPLSALKGHAHSTQDREILAQLGVPIEIRFDDTGRANAVRLPGDSAQRFQDRYTALAPPPDAPPPPSSEDPMIRLTDARTWQQIRPISGPDTPTGSWQSELILPSMFKGEVRQSRTYRPNGEDTFAVMGEGVLTGSWTLLAVVAEQSYRIEGEAEFDPTRRHWSKVEERWHIRAKIRAPRPPSAPKDAPLLTHRIMQMKARFSRRLAR